MENLKLKASLGKTIIIFLVLSISCSVFAAQTKPPSVLLQEGIYAEEVEGNLDEAIKIYQQVIASSEQVQQTTAQAAYRIALCYLKKGDNEQAAQQFEQLISKYPEQKSLVKEAQTQLEKLQPPVTLGFTPVIELEIPIYDENDSGIEKCFLDFETAKLFSLPENFNIKEDKDGIDNWLRQNKIDASAYLDGKTVKLGQEWHDEDYFAKVSNESWNNASPENVQKLYQTGTGAADDTRYEELPATFAFKTLEGNFGLLQILSTIDETIKIRYKMIVQEREVFLPDCKDDLETDDKVPVILDLSTGKLLPGSSDKQYFKLLNEGDIAYGTDDGKDILVCFRDGKITRKLGNGQYSDTPDRSYTDTYMNLYIIKIPAEMSFTTNEGDSYNLNIISKVSKGLNIKYTKTPPQQTIKTSIPAFSEPVTVTVYNIIHPVPNYTDRSLDLDEDKLLSIPDKEQKPDEPATNVKWLADHGGDIVAGFQGGTAGLMGFYMVTETLPGRMWDEMSPEELLNTMKDREIDPNKTAVMNWNEEGDQPVYAFADKNGSVGLLQMLSIDKESKKIELRYKKLKNTDFEINTRSEALPETVPVVISSMPKNYANDVPPGTDRISVTFDRKMMDKSWSWVKWNYPYPETTGSPFYSEFKDNCTLPVKLEPGKAYLVRVNAEPYMSFIGADGLKAQPFVFVFATSDANGKPTPIPQEMLDFAKKINSAKPDKPYTQEFYAEITPDGVLNFKGTITQKNTSGSTLKTVSFVNSDFVKVTSMQDEKGRPLKFTTAHNQSMYRYNVTLNEPVAPRETFSYTDIGTMTGQVKPIVGKENTYSFQMVHSPGVKEPALRIETYLLPEGAELISANPDDMNRVKVNGRIELRHKELIPAGGNIVTQFQYKLGK